MDQLLDQITSALKTATPVVVIVTSDQIETADRLAKLPEHLQQVNQQRREDGLPGQLPTPNQVEWSTAKGFSCAPSIDKYFGCNPPEDPEGLKPIRDAAQAFRLVVNGLEDPSPDLKGRYLSDAMFIMLGVGDFLKEGGETQAVLTACTLQARRLFPLPKFRNTLVLLVGSTSIIPNEIKSIAYIVDDPLPTKKELPGIIQTSLNMVKKGAGATFAMPDEKQTLQMVQACQGMTKFRAGQNVLVSCTRTGVDIEKLQKAQVSTINSTSGLEVLDDGLHFEDLGGLHSLKDFLRGMIGGEDGPQLVVFMDEVDKQLDQASAGDNTGVSQALTGLLLNHIQASGCEGITLVGPPGTGKSAIAAAAGREHLILTVSFNVRQTQGSLVGASEENLTTALKVLDSLYGSSDIPALWIVTCNRIERISPEMQRRFGTVFFVDLPTQEERDIIWKIYTSKYGLVDTDRPVDTNWTGAEIKKCVKYAKKFKISLAQAAKYIVPAYNARRSEIEAGRQKAIGNYLSASYPGAYVGSNLETEEEVLPDRMTLV